MPIYEYGCEKCGHQSEVLQKFSDPPITECELCHGKMKKLISHSSFHLKGTGWYVTDYASKSDSSNKPSRSSETRGGASETSQKASKVESKSSTEDSTKSKSSKKSD